jgi:Flp pilus assembly protein TadD
LKQKGDLSGAESALREAIRLRPDDPGPFNTLGQLLRQKGDIPGSKAAFAEGALAKKRLEDSQVELLNKK